MKLTEILKSFITFKAPPSVGDWVAEHRLKRFHKSSSHQDESFDPPIEYSNFTEQKKPKEKSSLEKIWFDNIFRVWISIITFALCFLLYFFGSITSFTPIVIIFLGYVFAEISATWLLLKSPYQRQIDYWLCGTDIIGISWAVYLTGGTESPLFFLYFIPLVIQAFHRDWALLVFYGFGGVLCYSITLFFSLESINTPMVANLSARIGSMLLTVSAAILAVLLLRKNEALETMRMSRMKMLMRITQILNGVTVPNEASLEIEKIVAILNTDFSHQLKSWSRVFLAEESGNTMISIIDKDNEKPEFKQELTTNSCPAVNKNSVFHIKNSDNEESCPTEKFSYKSHICIPISGTGNETYGVIFTGSKKPHAFGVEEKEFLEFIGRAIGLTLQRVKRVEELQLSLEMDSCATAAFLSSTKGVRQTYSAILEGIKNILKSDQTSIMMWEPNSGTLRVEESVGPHGLADQNLTYRMGEGVPGRVLEAGQPFWATDVVSDEKLKSVSFSFKSFVCLPLQQIKGEPLGVIAVWYLKKARPVSAYEIDIALTFITRATLAIENALLHEKVKKMSKPYYEGEQAA